jgi:hypothetical protein
MAGQEYISAVRNAVGPVDIVIEVRSRAGKAADLVIVKENPKRMVAAAQQRETLAAQ